MIVGVGCDIVDHTNTENLKWHTDLRVQSRIFSAKELLILPIDRKQQIVFLAGRFAVKEAVLKCLGTGIVDGISLKEIEVLKDRSQRPVLFLSGRVQKLSIKKEVTQWHLSLSHTDSTSMAFVIAEKV